MCAKNDRTHSCRGLRFPVATVSLVPGRTRPEPRSPRVRLAAASLLLAVALLLLPPFLSRNLDTGQAHAQSSGICDRSPSVREAILKALSLTLIDPIDDCALVTAAHLAGIETLNVDRGHPNGIVLQAGDFDGLTNLTALHSTATSYAESLPAGILNELTNLVTLTLNDHQNLQSLPDGVFDKLTNLQTLTLTENGLNDLASDVFDKLASLTTLDLSENFSLSLPDGIFDNLASLTTLNLNGNSLSLLDSDTFVNLSNLETLDLSDNFIGFLYDDIFSTLTNLMSLDLSDNTELRQIDGLNDVFRGLTTLSSLDLRNSPLANYTFTLEIEKTGASQFAVAVREGAPFAMTIGLSAQDGTLSADSVVIPAGSSRSAPVDVTPLGDAAVTVSLGALPSPPADFLGVAVAAGDAVSFATAAPTRSFLAALVDKFSEHVGANMETAYGNNKKYLAYFSASFFELVGGTVYIDLADLFGVTGEGADGWVSVWVDVTASKGIGFPVGAGISELSFHPSLPDPKRKGSEFTPPQVTIPGLRLELATLSGDGNTLNIETRVFGLSASALGVRKNLFRLEVKKFIIDDIIRGALTGCAPVCNAISLANAIVPQFIEGRGSLVGLPDLPARFLSSSDDGPGAGTRHDGQLELVSFAGELESPRPPTLSDPVQVVIPATVVPSQFTQSGIPETLTAGHLFVSASVYRFGLNVSFRNTGTEEGSFFVKMEKLGPEKEGDGRWIVCAADNPPCADPLALENNLFDDKYDIESVPPGESVETSWIVGVIREASESLKVRFKLYYDRLGPINELLDVVEVEFHKGAVIGSGNVGPEEVVEEVGKAVLTEVGREVAASAQAAVAGRIAQTAGGAPDPSLQLAGRSTLSEGLTFLAREFDRIDRWDREPDFGRMLGSSSFSLSLARPEKDGGVPADSVAVWGSGDYSELSGRGGPLSWNGSIATVHLGADSRLRPDLLAGVALSASWGAFDYAYDAAAQRFQGSYDVRMTNLFPYAGWSPSPEADVWGMVGYGLGEVRVEERTTGLAERADAAMKSVAAGASVLVSSRDDLLPDGTTTVRLKSDASLAQFEVEDNGSRIGSVTTETDRLRVGLEGGYERRLAAGGSLRFSLEAGLRRDGGDGQTGTGLELGSGLNYSGAGRVTAALSIRRLMTHEAGLDEWGVGGLIRLEPRTAGRGLSFDLSPAWGGTASGVRQLWRHGTPARLSRTREEPDPRLDANVGYGLGAIHPRGLLTPFGGLSLSGTGARQYRTGLRLDIPPSFTGSLEGARHEAGYSNDTQHGAGLRLGWRLQGAGAVGGSFDVSLEEKWPGRARAGAEHELMLQARMHW